MKKRFFAISLIVVMVVVSTQAMVFAKKKTKTIKMEVYETVVINDSVYCGGLDGLFKVKIKNGEPVSKQRIYKRLEGDSAFDMKKKGNYLYFKVAPDLGGTYTSLVRINLKTNKAKILAESDNPESKYAIKGKKLYYRGKQMKLNGKSKKKASVKIKLKYKTTNKKGYYANINGYETEDSYIIEHELITPKGRISLGKFLEE